MRRRLSHTWRVFKWLSTVSAILSFLVWLPNRTTTVRYVWPTPPQEGEGIWLGNGCIGYCGYVVIKPHLHIPQYVPPRTGISVGEPLGECDDPWLGTTVRFHVLGVRYCNFPASILLVGFGLLAGILWWCDLRRYRRSRKGFCLKCGYNLTGLPEPRCPECGRPFTRRSP